MMLHSMEREGSGAQLQYPMREVKCEAVRGKEGKVQKLQKQLILHGEGAALQLPITAR